MNKKDISSKDLLLLLLYSPGKGEAKNEAIAGRTRLMKMVFLFVKEQKKEFFSNVEIELPLFDPYNFGPFSKELFDDLNFFLSIGLIKTSETLIPISTAERTEIEIGLDDEWADAVFGDNADETVEMEYSLSRQGEKYVEDKIWDKLSGPQKQKLQQFKRQINTISLDSLLGYVYNKYPESTENSLIKNRYLKR
jgi:hypothetical protein